MLGWTSVRSLTPLLLSLRGSGCIYHSRLIPKDSLVLDALKDQGLKFEIAVGVNGAFWVKAEELRTTVAITNAILNSEMIKGKGDMIAMVQQVLKAAKRVD